MKAKILYILTTSALVMSAFLVGKSAAPRQIITKTKVVETEANTIQLEKAIPISDVACWYKKDGYITIELKDVTHQLDNYANVPYLDVLKDIPNETETYKNNMVNMSKVTDFSATENSLQLYMSDGSGYYWER